MRCLSEEQFEAVKNGHSVMTYMGKESKKEWIYVYVELIHFAVQQKLTQHF